jgi:hypothetical protein
VAAMTAGVRVVLIEVYASVYPSITVIPAWMASWI